MAVENKGFLTGDMKFNVGEEVASGTSAPLLPLRVLVVADLVPRDPYNAGASPPPNAIRLDGGRFDGLFSTIRPRIAIEVPSVLAGGRNTRIDLSPAALKSFRPDGLCAEVPLLRALLDGRQVLDRLRDGSITQDRARDELDRLWSGSSFVREILGYLPAGSSDARPAPAAAPAAPAPAGESSNLDALLAMVDIGGSSSAPAEAAAPPPAAEPSRADPTFGASGRLAAPSAPSPAPSSKFAELIGAVVQSARPRAGQPIRPNEAIAQIDRALGAQIGAILQHPEVRRLEEAWRGVQFLVERAKAHPGIRIDLICARPDDAASALARVLKETASTDPPATAAIVDVAVDGTAAAFARLEAIAKVAEANAMPAIVNGTVKLLGEGDLAAVERLDHKLGLFQAPHQAPWRSAAARHAMRWIAIAMNRALARAGYDKATSRVREAAIVELPSDQGAMVWLAPAYLVGALVLGSFRDTGWPCRIIGARTGGLVDNLQVHEIKSGYEGDEGVAIPTEAFISTDTQRDLAKAGVLALASAPNSDAVYVHAAPTAYVPPEKRTYDSATTEPEDRLERVSLVDQLFVGRVVQFLRALLSKLPASSDPAELQPVLEAAVWTLFENAPPAGVELKVKAHTTDEGLFATVTIRPRRYLGVALEEISLEMPVG